MTILTIPQKTLTPQSDLRHLQLVELEPELGSQSKSACDFRVTKDSFHGIFQSRLVARHCP